MIWFKIKELEKQLVAGKVPDFIIYKYLLSHLLLFALINNIPVSGVDTDPIWAPWIRLILVLVAITWGIGKTFEINRNGDNRNYFKRLISLSLVSSLRTIVAFIIYAAITSTAVIWAARMGFSALYEGFWSEILELVNYLFILLVYYYILISSFKRINTPGLYEEAEGEFKIQDQETANSQK
ncbi:hypothetical protein [Salinimicrobium terrae]|uniref:hypothetical protein n=1 Tax=Salinimicrobium terrae TaxID=470866 RepID=UPI000403DAC3|nr:hypothetical protein [Salinimicrobium terrae]